MGRLAFTRAIFIPRGTVRPGNPRTDPRLTSLASAKLGVVRVLLFCLTDIGFGKRGLLEKGSFQKSPFSSDSREFRDSRVSREPPQTVEKKGDSDHL